MSQNKLSIYHSLILGITLFFTLYLIRSSDGYIGFVYVSLFFIINSMKDIIFHKLGYTFRGTGIKAMIVVNIISLLGLSIWFFIFKIG